MAFRRANIANEIIVARDGAEALEYLFGTGKYADRDVMSRPSVVLMDLKLPKIDGLEVLRRLRADDRTRPTLVVILTSSGEEDDVRRGYHPGVNSYMRKPVNFERFAEAVNQIGRYWLVWNEPPK
jgi:CheY-like chemotaxis protein